MDREEAIKGLEQFKADFKPFCGNGADWERFDAGLFLLKEQKEIVRCENCRYAEVSPSGLIKCRGIFRSKEWFCADGLRKEEE